jgi:MoaA/NifB/PqqE/SkfB family radical SAM enzyme
MATLNVFRWLRYGPWLAQVVVTRRGNLTCGYCTEYDRTSDPASYDELALHLAKLAELRAWAIRLTGVEPTMHPIWSASTKNGHLASVPRFLQSR